MEKLFFLETKPVRYSSAGIKTLAIKMQKGEKCFLPHWHDRMELIRINHGRMYVECENERFELSENEIIVIPPKKMHKGFTLDEAVEYSVAMFDVTSFYNGTELCKNMLSSIFDGDARFNAVTKDEDIIDCFDKIFESNRDASLHTVAMVYRLVSLLYERELIEIREKPDSCFVKEVIEYLDENLSKKITVGTLSEKFGYSEAHFCRKFKEATGTSPMSYLKIHRLDMACRDIKGSDMSICDISQKFGFPDPNYFTRCFKERYELSPLRYRKLYH